MDHQPKPTPRHYRTIFISDLHLGTKGCQAERLLNFLQRHTCDHLFLVGDIVDGWHFKSGLHWPQSHTDVICDFIDRLKLGTRVTYVTGNHDEFLRRYSGLDFGNLRLVDEVDFETADGRRLKVLHGDQFDAVTVHHHWVAVLGDIGYSILLRVSRWLNWWRERMGFGYWSLSAWAKNKVKNAVNRVSNFESLVAHECRRNKYDGVVCGHIHRAEYRNIEGVDYYNCGDWVESCTALLEDENGSITVYTDEDSVARITKIKRRRKKSVESSTEAETSRKRRRT